MSALGLRLRRMILGEPASARLLAPAARPSRSLGLLAAILGFFAVLALALALAAERLAAGWEADLTGSAALQIIGEEPEMERQARAALEVLRVTPGVVSVRVVEVAEQRALIAPWLGADAAIDALPLPLTIAVELDRGLLDGPALAQALATAAPGAAFDDHAAWQGPLAVTAARLAVFAWGCLVLILVAFLAVAGLAAGGAVAASRRDLATLRLVGARDRFIAGVFTRRFTLTALAGAAIGTAAGAGLVAVLPAASEPGFFLVGIGLEGAARALPLAVPVVAAVAARLVAGRALRRALRQVG